MEVDRLRELNQDKAEQEEARGPARAEPEPAPIGDAIRDFHARDALAFGIPAHRSGSGTSFPTPWSGPAKPRFARTPA